MIKNNIILLCICSLLLFNCGIETSSVDSSFTEDNYQIITQKTNTSEENYLTTTLETNTTIESSLKTTQGNENLNSENKEIFDSVYKFIKSIEYENDDLTLFKELIDEKGYFAIIYFNDGRQYDSIVHMTKDVIKDEVISINAENTVGVLLVSIFGSDLSNLKIHRSDYLSSIEYPIDWGSTDVDIITEKLEDIIKTCKDIVLVNNENENELQVFVLNKNIYTLVNISVGKVTGFLYGSWAIFEKVNNEYFIRAVMILQ